jgi:calcium-translocating P-type ATPase
MSASSSSCPTVPKSSSSRSAPGPDRVDLAVSAEADRLQSDGLTTAEAEAIERDIGPNVLPEGARVPTYKRLLEQFVQFFALMLWAAGALAVVGGLPQLGAAIFVVIIVNGLFAFAQEYRAERAADRLRDLLPRNVIVIRDGSRQEVDARRLVPGDLVALADGDRVSADMTCVESHGLSIDTSTMTGESVPDHLAAGDVLHAGTFVVEGEGMALVTATGSGTELARIAVLTQSTHRPDTPLTRELHRLVRTVAIIALATGVSFFLMTMILDMPTSDGFVLAIGITVALVPEGLLPTVTLSLAIGAQRMSEQHALVRRLESVETLGSTTFICTDKTGTLTQNQMRVVDVWTSTGSAQLDGQGYEPTGIVVSADLDTETIATIATIAVAARTCSAGRSVLIDGRWSALGDPMEAAIDVLARWWVGDDLERRTEEVVRRFPFDPHRRRASVVTPDRVLVKGAPDSVVSRCGDTAAGAAEAIEAMTSGGLRVLAIAHRIHGGMLPNTADDAENDLILLGLLGFRDPPRPEARSSIASCRSAGIRVAMITGDHPLTARSIADLVGLRVEGAAVLIGHELPVDDDELAELVDHDGVVVARVSPDEKLRIARALRSRGHIVAMTGDGVNDAPALREADIGIAMGISGSDVAREAADLVLLDDNFATIVAAVRQGRSTFANARRFLTYHLTDNVAELTPFAIWGLSGGRFPLALGVLQVLALDIGTDTLSATALGAEPPAPHLMEQPPSSGRLLDRTVAIRAFGVLGPTEAVFEMGAFMVGLIAAGWRPGDQFPTGSALAAASGAAFMSVVIAQKANAFACRSTTRPAWRLDWTSNRFLLAAATTEIAFAVVAIAVPACARFLDQEPPPAQVWLVVLASAPAILLVDAVWKHFHFGRR